MDEPVRSRLHALLDLERLHGARSVPYLLHVLADPSEPTAVRIHIVRRLRNRPFTPAYRPTVAEALLSVLAQRSSSDLRLQAALSLAEFTDVEGVPSRLGSLALDPGESIDVRYSAFTSLQRVGPTAECVALLRQLGQDESLGDSARSVLYLWRQATDQPDTTTEPPWRTDQ
jgi:hypothetical protein